MFLRLSIVSILLLLSTAQIHAAEIALQHSLDFDYISVTGEIQPGDMQQITQLVQSKEKTSEVLFGFNSMGGSVYEAIRIGTYIRSNHFNTVILDHDICYSSCFFSFIGGMQRTVMPEGKLGVHEIYFEEKNDSDDQSLEDYVKSLALIYTIKMGIDAKAINLAFQTPRQSLYIFSLKEIEDYSIADIDPSSDLDDKNEAAGIKPNGIFWQKNGWYVIAEKNSCKIIKEGRNGKIIEIIFVGPRFIFLVIDERPFINPSLPDDTHIDVAFNFDGKMLSTLGAVQVNTTSGWGLLNLITEDDYKNFITNKMVQVVVNEKTIDEIDLNGAQEASRQLGLCALLSHF